MNKVYAVIDTNVLISGFLTKNTSSPTIMILDSLINGVIIPLYNKDILKEYHEVFRRTKFNLPKEKINWILKLIMSEGVSTERVSSKEFFPDPKDIVFYEVAMSKNDAYLVTGNIKHFPKKPFVVTPVEMVKIIGL